MTGTNPSITSQIERLSHVVTDGVQIYIDLIEQIESHKALYIGIGDVIVLEFEVLGANATAEVLSHKTFMNLLRITWEE